MLWLVRQPKRVGVRVDRCACMYNVIVISGAFVIFGFFWYFIHRLPTGTVKFPRVHSLITYLFRSTIYVTYDQDWGFHFLVSFNLFCLSKNTIYKSKENKTYNSGYSLVVTHPTTNPPIWGLSTAERTGCPDFLNLWSYVTADILLQNIYARRRINKGVRRERSTTSERRRSARLSLDNIKHRHFRVLIHSIQIRLSRPYSYCLVIRCILNTIYWLFKGGKEEHVAREFSRLKSRPRCVDVYFTADQHFSTHLSKMK